VLTLNDKIIVDDIVASCFEVNHFYQQVDNISMKSLFLINPNIMNSNFYKKYLKFWDNVFDNNVTPLLLKNKE
jgi:hypothetical protein